jgi:glycosyltransferase involved in cell wall biosynthesis
MSALPKNADRPLKILFVHAGAELYGADRVLLELMAGLREAHYELHLVLPGPGPLHAEAQRLGVKVLSRNLGVLRRKYLSLPGLLNRACRLVGAVRFLRRYLVEHGIDVVHSNTTAVFAGALAARQAGVPHIWHIHEITTRPRWFARLVAGAVAHLTDKAVFVSQASLDHMVVLAAVVGRKSLLIHNGIDDARALCGRRGVLRGELGWTESHVIIGMIGRINWWKGQDRFIDCAERLASAYPQARFVLVGGTFDGEAGIKDELHARIERAGLAERVVLKDFRPDIGNVLADLDVFVLPSTEPDPFPTVVLEAMAASLPVVGFRHGGVCEMVDDGVTGILCTPCETCEMSAAIGSLIDNKDRARAMGVAGRARLDLLFTRTAYVDRFDALYRAMICA